MLPAAGASPPEAFAELLEKRAPAFRISLGASALEKLSRFLAELDRERRKTNLTGPLTAAQLVDHALESGLGQQLIPSRSEVIDIGSGAGFPGIPLAILRPDIRVTPIEPRRKRIEFLKGLSERVGLGNVFVRETGLPNIAKDFGDVATARAVGRIDRILGRADFLKNGGLFLAWTTETKAETLAGRLKQHFSLESQLSVPQSRQRVIVAFRKHVPRGTSAPA